MNSDDFARSAVGALCTTNDETTVRMTQYIASKIAHQDKCWANQFGVLERRVNLMEKSVNGHTSSLGDMRVLTKSLQETVSCVVEVVKAFWIWEERFTRHSDSKHAEECAALEEIGGEVSALAERMVKFNDGQLGSVHNKLDEMEQRLSVVESLMCNPLPPSPIPRDMYSTNTSTSSAPDLRGPALQLPKFGVPSSGPVARSFASAQLQPVTSTVSSAVSPSYELPKLPTMNTDEAFVTAPPHTLASSTQSAAVIAEEQLQIYLTQVKNTLKEREMIREAQEESLLKKIEADNHFEQQVQQAQQTLKDRGVDLGGTQASDLRHARQHLVRHDSNEDFDPDSEGFGLVPRTGTGGGREDGGPDAQTFDDATSASGSGTDDESMPMGNTQYKLFERDGKGAPTPGQGTTPGQGGTRPAPPARKIAPKAKPAPKAAPKATPKATAKAAPLAKKAGLDRDKATPKDNDKNGPTTGVTVQELAKIEVEAKNLKELVDSPKPITVGRRSSLDPFQEPPKAKVGTPSATDSDFNSSDEDDKPSPTTNPKFTKRKSSSSSDLPKKKSNQSLSDSSESSSRKKAKPAAKRKVSESSSESSSGKKPKPKPKPKPPPAVDTDDDSSIVLTSDSN